MWADMTTTVTVSEGAAFVFVAGSLHNRVHGLHDEALEPIRQNADRRRRGPRALR